MNLEKKNKLNYVLQKKKKKDENVSCGKKIL